MNNKDKDQEDLEDELFSSNQNPIETVAQSVEGNLSLQREAMLSLSYSINRIRDYIKQDFSHREIDLKNLGYLARDIRDNFQFTLMLADEIGVIDELISQINLLALNITIEASKISDTGEVFSELSKDIREKSDKIGSVIERIFTKEVRNKSFREHNRYVQNNVLNLINSRIESLGGYLGEGEFLIREINSSDELLEDLIHSIESSLPLASTLKNFVTNCYYNNSVVHNDINNEMIINNKITEIEVVNLVNNDIIDAQKQIYDHEHEFTTKDNYQQHSHINILGHKNKKNGISRLTRRF